ncbi:DUF1832 domain-containing protein [bacterium]|nr:DUF1832 domain-containing protein [bacterium]
MNYNRIRFGLEPSKRLETLQVRTDLTANLLARIGFCASLRVPTVPRLADYMPESTREIDRHTLTGRWDQLFIALIKVRCRKDGIPADELLDQFKAHMNRGVLLLNASMQRIDTTAPALLLDFHQHSLSGESDDQ